MHCSQACPGSTIGVNRQGGHVTTKVGPANLCYLPDRIKISEPLLRAYLTSGILKPQRDIRKLNRKRAYHTAGHVSTTDPSHSKKTLNIDQHKADISRASNIRPSFSVQQATAAGFPGVLNPCNTTIVAIPRVGIAADKPTGLGRVLLSEELLRGLG